MDGLLDPAVSFFSFRAGGELLGVGAIKRLDAEHGEIKSMHTAAAADSVSGARCCTTCWVWPGPRACAR